MLPPEKSNLLKCLDASLITQVKKSQKADYFHLDAESSVGNAASRWKESTGRLSVHLTLNELIFISVDIRVISSTGNQQKAFEFPLESQSELDKSKSRSWCFEPVDLTSFSSWSRNQHAHLYNCRTDTFKYTRTSQGEGNRISVNALQIFFPSTLAAKGTRKRCNFLATNCIY